MQAIFKGLNEEQKNAVLNTEGSSVILAGAGSGKTRVLVHKVIYLIEEKKVNPQNILMITFTNKAAAEMKTRMGEWKIGFVGTFHSLCAQILRIDGSAVGLDRNFAIYDDDDQISLIKKILKKHNIGRFTPSYFSHRISNAKNELIFPKNYLSVFSDYAAGDIAQVYKDYQTVLKQSNACDFDDLILKVIELFTTYPEILEKYQNKYKYILVDEFQDTNPAQYALTKLLAKMYQNITAVGDFSQSIYSWRGADIRNLEKFQTDFPETKIFHLEKNYRSTRQILNFAYKIISQNKTHPILHLQTDNVTGDEIVFLELGNEEEEALFITQEIEKLKDKYSSFAVLYRTNAQSRIMEETFLHYGISYALIGGTRFYERREIRDVLSYLRLLVNHDDPVAKDRIEKLGKRRWEKFKNNYKNLNEQKERLTTVELMEEIFKETDYLSFYKADDAEDYSRLENIKELKSVALSFPNLVEFLEQVALVESEYFEKEKKAANESTTVKMMTLHACKGLEFDCVFIVGVEEGLLPHSLSIDDNYQIEEERRLFYVGITRARHRLYITSARRRFIFGRRNEALKSRFLMEEVLPTGRQEW